MQKMQMEVNSFTLLLILTTADRSVLEIFKRGQIKLPPIEIQVPTSLYLVIESESDEDVIVEVMRMNGTREQMKEKEVQVETMYLEADSLQERILNK